MRRLGWFIAGATAGAGAMRMARRRVRSAARQLSPRHVRDRVEQRVRSKVDEVGDAIREGRAARRLFAAPVIKAVGTVTGVKRAVGRLKSPGSKVEVVSHEKRRA